VIGLGSVSRCTLPLLFDELPVDPSRYTVIDFGEVAPDAVRSLRERGAAFQTERITPENYQAVLGARVGPGDLVIDLAWNIDTLAMLDWCRNHGVQFINASLEVWDPYEGIGFSHPRDRTLYARHMALRKLIDGWRDNSGPTAVLDHGANPGLVSHFTKQGLLDIAEAWLNDGVGPQRDAVAEAAADQDFARLAQALGVATIHISERDTQVSSQPKRENEFVNTWSVLGFHEDGIAPAELGWGTHEKPSRPEPRRTSPALSTRSASRIPAAGRGSAPGSPAARSSGWLSAMRRDLLQDRHRIMDDDIVEGRDELGCLLMGHPFKSWWVGSLLDIDETRRLAPGQNATTLQVAASLLAATRWMVDHPREGVLLPDDLPHEPVLDVAKPYLGPFVSRAVDWTPLDNWHDGFAGYGRPRPLAEDVWQFSTFLIRGPE